MCSRRTSATAPLRDDCMLTMITPRPPPGHHLITPSHGPLPGVARRGRRRADRYLSGMKFFPRSLATLTLAVAAVPGVAPLTVQAPVSTPAHVPAPVPMIPAPTPGGWTSQA